MALFLRRRFFRGKKGASTLLLVCCMSLACLFGASAVHGGLPKASHLRLLEVFLGPGCSAACNLEVIDALQRNASEKDIVVVHECAGGQESASLCNGQFPCVLVNRHEAVFPSSVIPWKRELQSVLQKDAAAQKWALTLYLSLRESRHGAPEVDIAVCNLEKERTFSGHYAIWLLQQAPQGPNYWTRRQVLAAGEIFELPQDETRGCPMPDHFAVPGSASGERLGLAAVVFDEHGAVQAAALEPLPSQEER